MLRRVFWLGLVCACTQDFGAFDPLTDAAAVDASNDALATDALAADVGPDVTGDVSVTDGAPDVSPPIDAAPDALTCTETGSIVFGGHCYFPLATTQNFAAAKASCVTASAHLVSITTSGEQAAVIALGTGERWMGLFRNNGPPKDGNYAWITGEGRNNFNAWSPGEPNGSGQCARLLATGLWADDDCTVALAAICERE